MNKRLSEEVKFSTSQISGAFTGAATTVNGRGAILNNARKVAFRFILGGIASTDTDYTLSVLEATDSAVIGARNVGNALTTPTVTLARVADGCIADANIVQLTMFGVLAAQTITINGVTFTAVAAATDLAANEYDQRGNDTADAGELVEVINNALPNLIATNNAAVITIQSREVGQETITVTGITDVATVIPVTVEVVAHIEIDSSTLSDGYNHVFPRALTGATSAAATLNIQAIKGNYRYRPVGVQAGGEAYLPDN